VTTTNRRTAAGKLKHRGAKTYLNVKIKAGERRAGKPGVNTMVRTRDMRYNGLYRGTDKKKCSCNDGRLPSR